MVNSKAKNTKYKVSNKNLTGSHYVISFPITPEVDKVIIQLINEVQYWSSFYPSYTSSTYVLKETIVKTYWNNTPNSDTTINCFEFVDIA